AWSKLLGGPVYSTSYGDNLTGRVVEPGEVFPPHGRKVIVDRAAKPGSAKGRMTQRQAGPAPRLKESEVDVVVYEVEGVLSIAHRVEM
ncbi:hypothetical protein HK104_008113, partial [Borealophlyctis nickersoniae]